MPLPIDDIKNLFEKVLSGSQSIRFIDLTRTTSSDGGSDLIADMDFNGTRKEINVIWSPSSEPRILKRRIFEIHNLPLKDDRYTVLISPYVSVISAELLKENGIGFIDLSGNTFLSFDNVLIDKRGGENRFKTKRTLKSLFTKRSTRIIRKLLIDPERKWKISDLSKESDVSTGFVSLVIKQLSTEGYIDRERGSIKILSPGDLLEKWAQAYKFDISNIKGYYCPFKDRKQIFEKLRDISIEKYALTMGAAASIIAPHVRSTDTYLYSLDDTILIDILDLELVEFGGNLYLMEPYDIGVLFDKQVVDALSIVSNIQLYLDLYNYPARGREQAEFLRNNVMEY